MGATKQCQLEENQDEKTIDEIEEDNMEILNTVAEMGLENSGFTLIQYLEAKDWWDDLCQRAD